MQARGTKRTSTLSVRLAGRDVGARACVWLEARAAASGGDRRAVPAVPAAVAAMTGSSRSLLIGRAVVSPTAGTLHFGVDLGAESLHSPTQVPQVSIAPTIRGPSSEIGFESAHLPSESFERIEVFHCCHRAPFRVVAQKGAGGARMLNQRRATPFLSLPCRHWKPTSRTQGGEKRARRTLEGRCVPRVRQAPPTDPDARHREGMSLIPRCPAILIAGKWQGGAGGGRSVDSPPLLALPLRCRNQRGRGRGRVEPERDGPSVGRRLSSSCLQAV